MVHVGQLRKEQENLKTFLRLWEQNFQKNNGREPTEDDVAHKPNILKKYKKYAQVKKQVASLQLNASKQPGSNTLQQISIRVQNSPLPGKSTNNRLTHLHRAASHRINMVIPESPDVVDPSVPLHLRLEEKMRTLATLSPEQVAQKPSNHFQNRTTSMTTAAFGHQNPYSRKSETYKRKLHQSLEKEKGSTKRSYIGALSSQGNDHLELFSRNPKQGIQKSMAPSPIQCPNRRENLRLGGRFTKQNKFIRSLPVRKHSIQNTDTSLYTESTESKVQETNWQRKIFGTPQSVATPAQCSTAKSKTLAKKPKCARVLRDDDDEEGTTNGLSFSGIEGALELKPKAIDNPTDGHSKTPSVEDNSTVKNSKSWRISSGKDDGDGLVAKKKSGEVPLVSSTRGTQVSNRPVGKGEVSSNFVKINLKRGYQGRSRIKRGKSSMGFASGFGRSDSSKNRSTTQRKRKAKDAVDECFDEIGSALQQGNDAQPLETDMECVDPMHLPPSQTPLCTGHGEPSVCNVVKKKNANHGRRFFGCRFGMRSSGGCGFFQWADDVRESALRAFHKEESREDYNSSRLAKMQLAWAKKSVPELKSMLRRWNGSTTGKKDDLIARLVSLYKDGIQNAVELREKLHQGLDKENQNSENTNEVIDETLQTVFGFDELRSGQEWAIKRSLFGKSSLLVQPTGAGKSLCFQLPSFILPGLTLVITPLISLMDDQMNRLPPAISGACLHGGLSKVETGKVLRSIRAGFVDILFISPERLCSESFRSVIKGGVLSNLSMVCVDEAHCISAWSHNFRPSYMRIHSVINDPDLGLPRCPILALTATATSPVVRNICQMLVIDGESSDGPGRVQTPDLERGVLVGDWFRPELQIATKVVPSDKRLVELLRLLKSDDRFAHPNSVIIYANTKNEVNVLVERLQGELSQGTRKANTLVRPYHAGMASTERKRTQELFISNKVRIIVATVAFGMGIDKSDVRAIIHYGMPRSVDNFVQELGRAGRDGESAWGMVLFSQDDAFRLHSLGHSNDLEHRQISAFLANMHLSQRNHPEVIASGILSQPNSCCCLNEAHRVELVVDVAALENDLNLKESIVETLLVQLSLEPYDLVNRMYPSHRSLSLNLLKTASEVHTLDSKAQQTLGQLWRMRGESNRLSDVQLLPVASKLGLTVKQVAGILRRLQEERAISGLEMKENVFVITANTCFGSNCSRVQIDLVAKKLHQHSVTATRLSAQKVESMYAILSSTVQKPTKDVPFPKAAETFDAQVKEYFTKRELETQSNQVLPWNENEQSLKLAQSDCSTLMNSERLRGLSFKPHLVACILHAVPSAQVEYSTWNTSSYWGKWKRIPFMHLKELAKELD